MKMIKNTLFTKTPVSIGPQSGYDNYIMARESSCDETACAVLRGIRILSNKIASQIEIHKRFGGVVPEIASRNHVLAIDNLVGEALAEAGVKAEELDAIGVTYGAGLLGALLVGESYAKALAYALDKPLYAVNHIRGHIAVNYIASPELEPPFVCLIASGGHTAIALAKGYDEMKLLGTTQDDACGEAFDKVARVLGLPYPGGPRIQELAAGGKPVIPLPHPFRGSDTLDFSFSGIKTEVINYANSVKMKGEELPAADVVPVVRCQECKHWTDWGACGHPRNGWDAAPMGPDDFCSYGEKAN